jgi:hypothetical protein
LKRDTVPLEREAGKELLRSLKQIVVSTMATESLSGHVSDMAAKQREFTAVTLSFSLSVFRAAHQCS